MPPLVRVVVVRAVRNTGGVDDIVAVEVVLVGGSKRYFLTFGRIQHNVDPAPLTALVLGIANTFPLGGEPVAANVCATIREAADSAEAPTSTNVS